MTTMSSNTHPCTADGHGRRCALYFSALCGGMHCNCAHDAALFVTTASHAKEPHTKEGRQHTIEDLFRPLN